MSNNVERLNQLRAAVEEAGPGDAKAALEAALAEALIHAGDYADALLHLGNARRSAESQPLREHVDLHMGLALLRRGENERAEPHLERTLEAARLRGDASGEARALAFLGELYARRGEIERAQTALDQAHTHFTARPSGDLLARTLVAQSLLALAEPNSERALALSEQAVNSATLPDSAGARSAALLAVAEARRRIDDLAGAEAACRQAIAAAAEANLPRELADAYFAYAHLLGTTAGAGGTESPAAWLARAQELYRDHGALADLERVREAFRRFGRRATDHVAANEVKEMIDDLRSSRLDGRARGASAGRHHRRGVGPRRGRAAAAAARATAHAHRRGAGGRAFGLGRRRGHVGRRRPRVRRHAGGDLRAREHPHAARSVPHAQRAARLGPLVQEICKMAAQLTGADRALVGIIGSDGTSIEVRAAFRLPELSAETGWRTALERVLKGGGPLLVQQVQRQRARPSAPATRFASATALGTPLRQGDKLFGAVYVDKDLCGGVFTPHDLDLLAIFCAAGGDHAGERARRRGAAAGRAHRAPPRSRPSPTACSRSIAHGQVTSINAAAARILGVRDRRTPAQPAPGRFARPGVFCARLSSSGEELDGRVTRIGAGDYLVNARVVRSDARRVGRRGGHASPR